MKTVLPVALAVWATLASVGTFAWLTAPERPATEASAAPPRTMSGPIAVMVRGREGAHYLTFKLDYVLKPGTAPLVPVEAAARDVLIEAAGRTPDLAHAERWEGALETVLRADRARLGVESFSVERAERRRAP